MPYPAYGPVRLCRVTAMPYPAYDPVRLCRVTAMPYPAYGSVRLCRVAAMPYPAYGLKVLQARQAQRRRALQTALCLHNMLNKPREFRQRT